MSEEEQRDTQESAAVDPAESVLGGEGAEAIGDPAAASVDADVDPDPVAFMPPTEAAGEYGGEYGGQSPAEADYRAEPSEGAPLATIAGAFVGGFAAAKLLGLLGGGDD